MVLLYTGAEVNNKPQPDPSRSLGGLVSNTPLANGRLGNLFPAVTKSTVISNQKEIRLIALKNTTGATVNTVRIWTITATDKCKLQIAAVGSAANECGDPVFEQVYDDTSTPFQATLDYHEGEVNAIAVGSIVNGAIIGIWIRREIDATKFPTLIPPTTPLTCQETADQLDAVNIPNQDENVELIIDWA